MRGVVLVTGAHGVGKTRLIQSVSTKIDIPSFTASELIRFGNQESMHQGTKIVKGMASNQEMLIASIDQVLRKQSVFLLDGHTSLFTSNETVEVIAIDYFLQMSLLGVILLDSDTQSVIRNIQARDGLNAPVSIVDENLNLEREHSSVVAEKLGLPYFRIHLRYNDSDSTNFIEAIRSMKGGGK